jgi:hypothetical protein
MDLRQLGYWLIFTCFVVAIPLLVKVLPLARRLFGPRLGRLGMDTLERLRPLPEVDQLAEDLARVLRRERLRNDLARVRRLVATDEAMSATRQLGNRLAYNWLVRELQSIPGPSQPVYAGQPVYDQGDLDRWRDFTPLQPQAVASAYQGQRPPEVEILELGWRR